MTCYSLLDLLPRPPAVIESGKANFDGIDLLQCSNDQMRQFRGNDIAMIFQDPMTSLNPFLTIGEQLIEPLIYHSDKLQRLTRSKAKQEAVALLDEVGIVNLEAPHKSDPHGVSRGMRRRVRIAITTPSSPVCTTNGIVSVVMRNDRERVRK